MLKTLTCEKDKVLRSDVQKEQMISLLEREKEGLLSQKKKLSEEVDQKYKLIE